jgi:hypothetical protein
LENFVGELATPLGGNGVCQILRRKRHQDGPSNLSAAKPAGYAGLDQIITLGGACRSLARYGALWWARFARLLLCW